YPLQTSFVSHLLRRAREREAERFEQTAHPRRELIEALAVTATEADAGQTPQAFAVRVSHGHRRQRRDDRDFTAERPCPRRVERLDDPRRQQPAREERAADGEGVCLLLDHARDEFGSWPAQR